MDACDRIYPDDYVVMMTTHSRCRSPWKDNERKEGRKAVALHGLSFMYESPTGWLTDEDEQFQGLQIAE